MATIPTEKIEKLGRLGTLAAILDISIGGAYAHEIAKRLNLSLSQVEAYYGLIENLGLGYAKGMYCETTLKGIDFIQDYRKTNEALEK